MAFGLLITSDIRLPIHQAPTASISDINITKGTPPLSLNQVSAKGALFESNSSEYLLKVPGTGDFHISNGKDIIYHMTDPELTNNVVTHILASCMAAVLHQRGDIVLHASGIIINGGVILFGGPSGVGKSTAATMMSKSGYPLISDDVTVLRKEGNSYKAWPGYPFSRLWQDSLQNLDISSVGLETSIKSKNKYIVPSEKKNFPCDLNVGVKVNSLLLITLNGSDTYSLQQIKAGQAIIAVSEIIFRKKMCIATNGSDYFFQQLTSLAKYLDIYEFNRPFTQWKPNELKELITTIK